MVESRFKWKSKTRGAAMLVASCAFAGYFPLAPGTVGSVVGVLADRLLRAAGSPILHGVAILVVSLVGAAAATVVERALSRKDPSVVVVDEVAGMLLGLYLIPLSWPGLMVGFLVFRILDIVKPFPCRQAEGLSGGVGIMADDLIAGVYTNGILRVACLWWPVLLSEA